MVKYGGFLKWWYPTTMGFPIKMIILGCFGDTTILRNTHIVYSATVYLIQTYRKLP